MTDDHGPEIPRLFRKHRHELERLAKSITGCSAIAEDVVQEAFIKLSRRDPAEELNRPIAFLVQIVKNLSIDAVRKKKRERLLFEQQGVEEISRQVSKADSPEARLVLAVDQKIIRDALAELPLISRRAVHMHMVEGRKLREIAEKLNISVGKSHSLVKDGMAFCRDKLTGDD